MSRRKIITKRQIIPDPKFNSEKLARFINVLMQRGKKSVAEKIVYGAIDEVGNKAKEDGLEILYKALDNVKPMVEVKSRRVGGATYQVPVEVSQDRQVTLAMRWIVDIAKKRSEKSMKMRLANELLDAYSQKGAAIKKREDTHRMAEANKAFAHYRW